MHIRRIWLIVPVVLLLATGCTVIESTETIDPALVRSTLVTSFDAQRSSIKVGYHYKPPAATSSRALAEQASFLILTKKDESFRDEVRAAGYTGQVLQYMLGNEVDGPRTQQGAPTCDATYKPYANQVADEVGDFCTYINPNEDWFLHNGKGERLYDGERRYYHMNPGSAGWRAFVLKRLQRSVAGDAQRPPLGYDGLFIDNIELTLYKKLNQLDQSDGVVREYADEAAYREAWRGWLEYMRNGLGPSVPLWGNLIAGTNTADEWNLYLPYLDGVMDEAFATGYNNLSPADYANDLAQAEQVLAQGKGLYAVSQGAKDDLQRQQFALASFLLIAQPDAPNYFRYARSDGAYDEWWLYDNYNVQLGAPLGARYKVKNGWRRDFQNGAVIVDSRNRTGRIVRETATAMPSTPASTN